MVKLRILSIIHLDEHQSLLSKNIKRKLNLSLVFGPVLTQMTTCIGCGSGVQVSSHITT